MHTMKKPNIFVIRPSYDVKYCWYYPLSMHYNEWFFCRNMRSIKVWQHCKISEKWYILGWMKGLVTRNVAFSYFYLNFTLFMEEEKRRLLFLQSISNNKYKFSRCPFLMFFLCQVSVKLERTFEVYVERMYIVCTLKPFWICLNTFKRNFSENQVRYLRKQICSKYWTILLLDNFFAV